MNKRWSILPAFAGILLGLASCYPGEVTSVQQLDVVVTAHNDTVTFTSFTTFALLDSVVHIDLEDNANDRSRIVTSMWSFLNRSAFIMTKLPSPNSATLGNKKGKDQPQTPPIHPGEYFRTLDEPVPEERQSGWIEGHRR